jgi:hypothetical protein
VKQFAAFLEHSGALSDAADLKWRGHAYLASGTGPRAVIDEGMLLIGDAAGLAYPESGEGIRPAIESGRLAARTLAAAAGRTSRSDLQPYADEVRRLYPPASRTPRSASIRRCRHGPSIARLTRLYASRGSRSLVPRRTATSGRTLKRRLQWVPSGPSLLHPIDRGARHAAFGSESRRRDRQGTDGEIGTLEDFYFEEAGWNVRYLLVDTGSWFDGKRVLLSPSAVQGDWGAPAFTSI